VKPKTVLNLSGTPLTERDLEVLSHSFITPELADQAMLRRVSSAEGAAIVGRNGSGDYSGVIFPYVQPVNNFVRDYRLRRDNPDLEQHNDGTIHEKAKYLAPPGRASMLYFVPGTLVELLKDVSLDIVITEGEKKTLALYRLSKYKVEEPKFLSVGIPGVWNWRGIIGKTDGPNGERLDVKGPIADLDLISWTGRKVFILFDSNVKTNSSVRRARSELTRELTRRGAKVFFIKIPEEYSTNNYTKSINGVDDLLAVAGPEYVLSLFRRPEQAEVKVPLGFRLGNEGVFAIDPTGESEDIWICSPLRIIASTRNHKSEDWGQILELTDKDGSVHIWAMPMTMLASDGSEYRARLLSMGLRLAPGRKARELLTNYIQTANPDARIRCVDQVGWYGNVFVLPDETIGDEEEQVLFQSVLDSKHKFSVSGTPDEWRENVSLFCSKNSRLIFAVSLAFAGPLLPIIGEGGGGFHLRGISSIGKTTALQVAGSVWGGGGNIGFVQTWRTTANGLEAMAELHNHALLCLDEMGQCDPRELGGIAYTLANGIGKSRMTRSLGLRKKLEWDLMFLSSGEISLADHVVAAGRRVRGGQEVRLIDIDSDAGTGLGIFEHIHGFESPFHFAQHLRKMSLRYYGSPIHVYLAAIVRKRDYLTRAVLNFRDRFIKDNVLPNSSGEVYRAASRFAVVAAAGEVATGEGITGWTEGEALKSAQALFRNWLASRGTSGNSETESAIRQVRAFIETHGASRFHISAEVTDNVINRAGFKEEDTDGLIMYLILPEVFRNEVCKGYDYRTVAKLLSERGLLETDSDNKRLTVRRRLSRIGQVRVYALRSSILESEE
jgi:putative DNA primase/helicase